MRRFLLAIAVLAVVGVVVAGAFGWDALVVYAFFALLAVGTAVGVGLGGEVVQRWSSRRFDDERPRGA
jgi:predicted RND superfamily exporter protein